MKTNRMLLPLPTRNARNRPHGKHTRMRWLIVGKAFKRRSRWDTETQEVMFYECRNRYHPIHDRSSHQRRDTSANPRQHLGNQDAPVTPRKGPSQKARDFHHDLSAIHPTNTMNDDDGEEVQDGDEIFFSYGIPPVRVTAQVEYFEGELWALTPGHNPSRCRLSELRDYVELFYKL